MNTETEITTETERIGHGIEIYLPRIFLPREDATALRDNGGRVAIALSPAVWRTLRCHLTHFADLAAEKFPATSSNAREMAHEIRALLPEELR